MKAEEFDRKFDAGEDVIGYVEPPRMPVAPSRDSVR